ncbi:pyridoxal phosphate-dependent aminotransferase [Tindallia californiensis]|uniref:L-threonine O-3-phosphate decarboxylase n=1 Tax=Tindallia californiensis TaxID=159292 RepID=A0A1H3I982_9FIRM|nr:histidinol-phosphate transaminase [Tindallia californiensis]SDY24240.1 L-threonine O-3-phosphate decarboxylase [Tindallia californiensis]
MEHGGNVLKIGKEIGIDPHEILDFSANISPFKIPDGLIQLITQAQKDISIYPDPKYYELRKALAHYASTEIERIVPGNGAAQIIHDAIRLINPVKTMLPVPTFSEYEAALEVVGSSVVYFKMEMTNHFKLNVGKLINQIDETFDLLVLCNPNNPTGNLITRKEMNEILEKCQKVGCKVIVDEAFIEFVTASDRLTMASEIHKWNHLIIIRAFTKIFAIPGIRLGYGIYGCLELSENHRKHAVPWSVNVFAESLRYYINSVEASVYIKKVSETIKLEKEIMEEAIKKMEAFTVFPSHTNYLLIRLSDNEKYNVERLYHWLLKRQILIRKCNNFNGMPSRFFRVAVKKKEENRQLIDSLLSVNNIILNNKQC